MNRFAKSAVVVSSLLLAGALIAYEGGYIPLGFSASAQTPQDAGTQQASRTILPGSKSRTIDVAVPASAAAPAASQPPVMMFSSKSAAISPAPAPATAIYSVTTQVSPSATGATPGVILPSSKFLIVTPAPSAPTPSSVPASAPTVFIGGSKTIIVTPPPAASQTAQQKGGQ